MQDKIKNPFIEEKLNSIESVLQRVRELAIQDNEQAARLANGLLDHIKDDAQGAIHLFVDEYNIK
ncbi:MULTISPECIES: hypothetical protein [Priestia]|uniref:hypothetical protein n=1 Tax=Priestia TaxID=2800373 RepID=UPI001128A761|nr:hypothetical protein [Priestia megaterium]TPF18048.1 hypothetical protein CBE78_02135 [Priestia megaterium]TPF22155.1 hypothetical protein CBE79_04640 [Priestia megaterium]